MDPIEYQFEDYLADFDKLLIDQRMDINKRKRQAHGLYRAFDDQFQKHQDKTKEEYYEELVALASTVHEDNTTFVEVVKQTMVNSFKFLTNPEGDGDIHQRMKRANLLHARYSQINDFIEDVLAMYEENVHVRGLFTQNKLGDKTIDTVLEEESIGNEDINFWFEKECNARESFPSKNAENHQC